MFDPHLQGQLIGRVLRANTMGFTCGTRSNEISTPAFGAFVETRHSDSDDAPRVIGLIYGIHIDDDPLVRQLILANNLNQATIRDQHENRMVPVEISVVNIGYIARGEPFYSLPARPPISLDAVSICDQETIFRFTSALDFFRLVLNTSEVPTEELVAAALLYAADTRSANERREFLIGAGRRLASMLSHDLARLNHLLKLIRP